MERQQHLSTESTYHEQKRLYLELKAEADRAIEQQKNYSEALSEVDTAKNALAEEIYELKETNRKLKVMNLFYLFIFIWAWFAIIIFSLLKFILFLKYKVALFCE